MAGTRTWKALNVAEKNDAARALSSIMGRGRVQRREGLSKYNKIYEFNFNILGKDMHMIMTSVSGHLLSLDFASAYRKWNNCTPETLFSADVKYYCPDEFTPIKTLEKEVRGCQYLILWTDGDREGENIADEIKEVVTQVKTRGLTVYRARFSEITPRSVMSACANLSVLDQKVSDAVKVRRELDLRIGSTFTRFQTKLLTRAFPSVLSDQLISYGPCQFPTLGFVVERFNEIQAFVSETFYKIVVTHEIGEDKVEFSWQRGRIFHHTVCLVLYQFCLEDPLAHVIGTTTRPRSKWRPLPLDTVELEKLGSRKLHINAKETMRLAEKLYTQGFISYPRTETNIFPDSFDLQDVIQGHTGDPQWGEFATRLLNTGPTPRQGNRTDNAHPPIYPTKYTDTLTGNEKRIYELVVRHFLACCSQDAKGQETKVEIEINKERFTAQGLVILERNYLDVYPYDKWTGKIIPAYETGSTFQPTSIEMVSGETTPPPLLQEADLIGLMEKHGIGTDATHADHIETIKTRNYVGVEPNGGFVPGELGMGLVEGYDSMGYELSKPQLRAELESDLKRICDGTKSKEEVLKETIRKYKEVFLNAKAQSKRLEESLSKFFGQSQQVPAEEEAPPTLSEPIRKCPKCLQYNLVVKQKRDGGYILSCVGYPDCRAVQFFPKFVLEAKRHDSTCPTCQPQPVHKVYMKFKEGSIPVFMDKELVACTTCDPVLLEDLAFGPIRLTTAASSSNSGGGSGPRGGMASGDGHGSRGGVASSHRGGRGARGRGSSQRSQGDHGDDGWGSGPGGGGGGGVLQGASHNSGQATPGYSGGVASMPSGYNRENTSNRSAMTQYHHTPTYNAAMPTFGSGSGHNPITCNCGDEAILLTVRKEDSVNKGRQFYKCPRPTGSGCDFFLWADQSPLVPPPGSHTSATAAAHNHNSINFPPPPATRTPCDFAGGMNSSGYHHLPNPNTSRQAQYGSSSASFQPSTSRQWQRGRGGGGGGRGGASRATTNPSSSSAVVMCNCEQVAVQRTVQKEGPNKGRQFYTCSKPRESQCGFFEWSDSVPTSNVHHTTRGGQNSWRRGHGRGGASRGGGGGDSDLAVKKRAPSTCSVCREVGHTKRSCPLAKN